MEVVVNYLEGKKFSAKCGKHNVIVDLPEEAGGQDSGPTPPDYFLVSLASCVGVYVLAYSDNVGMDTKGLRITISAEKSAQPSRLDNIKIIISLPKAEVGNRKEALLSVAKKCLIHNTITSHPQVEINLLGS